jgi:hypothetical protein
MATERLTVIDRRRITPETTIRPEIVDQHGNRIAFEGRDLGPSTPLPAELPRGSEPRQFYPRTGYNLVTTPRAEFANLTPFSMLRALAEGCDVVRVVLEDLKGQLCGFGHEVGPKKDEPNVPDADVQRGREILKSPDGFSTFDAWLSRLVEEIMVVDALSIYRHRAVDGTPLGSLILDGTTIKPIVDFHGIPPHPPEVAFQQYIAGRVETEYTRPWQDAELRQPDGKPKDEIVYSPRWPRTWTAYGHSPVEWIIVTINLVLRRQMHYLAWYTDGNIPDAFWKTPENWQAAQVREMQEVWDEMLAGDSERRAKMRFMPGGAGTGLENPRGQDSWQPEFEEYLARLTAWSFGVSALPIVRMMNRATAEAAEQAAADAGVKPLAKFVAGVINRELAEFHGLDLIEFRWTVEKDEKEQLKVDRNVRYVSAGILGRDEVRDELGRDPLGVPVSIDTSAGPVPVIEALGDLGPARPRPAPAPAGAADASSGDALEPATGQDAAARALEEAPDITVDKAARADLRRWRRIAARAAAQGARQRTFSTATIPKQLKSALADYLGAGVPDPHDVDWAFRVLAKARRPLVAARRRLRLERQMRAKVRAHFKRVAPKLAAVAVDSVRSELGKVTGLDRSWSVGMADDVLKAKVTDKAIADALEVDTFREEMQAPLEESFLEAEVLAGDQAGIEVDFALTSEQATVYAEERSAELVGKFVNADGTVREAKRAAFRIQDSIRDDLNRITTRAVAEGWSIDRLERAITGPSFWASRAQTISRTEIANAINAGSLEVYKEAGVNKVDVLDGPGCLVDGHQDGATGVNGEQWTLAKSRKFPLGHPNCRRDFAPV